VTHSQRIVFLGLALLLAFCRPPALAQGTVTVSGTIRHQGKPVAGAAVRVVSGGVHRWVETDANGVYRVDGIGKGNWAQVFVWPAVERRLAFRNWRVDAIAADVVKDFDLETGNLLSGMVVRPDGQTHSQGFWLGLQAMDLPSRANEWGGAEAQQGRFSMVLEPGLYVQGGKAPPYFIPPKVIDLRRGDVTGYVVNLTETEERPAAPPSGPPPLGERVTTGAPDTDGYAQVNGAGGAVEPNSEVIVVNLNSHNVARATADAEGAFSTRMFAPPGAALLIKHDPGVRSAANAWREVQEAQSTMDVLNPLPGTIVRAGALAAREAGRQPVQASGAIIADGWAKGWAGWWFTGDLEGPFAAGESGLRVQPGQRLRITGRLRITSPAFSCAGLAGLNVTSQAAYYPLFGPDGRALATGPPFAAHLFTPTGLPIESEWGPFSRAFSPPVSAPVRPLSCAGNQSVEGSVDHSLTVPGGLPAGVYVLRFEVNATGMTLDRATPLALVVGNHIPWRDDMALLTVGLPATPRIPWTMLSDHAVNGQRGIGAREDAGSYATSNRVLISPHRTILPRLDERSGQPVAYRLEPGSQWVSVGDRRQPHPPVVPFSLPSGELTARVRRPDGAIDTLGPAPVRQSLQRMPTTPGGSSIAPGSGRMSDIYHLFASDGAFAYRFANDGEHVIELSGHVKDVFGTTYPIQGTYDLTVARVLDLDPGQLPTTPYLQGDAFAPGLHLFPPVPAEVGIRIVHLPGSDPAQAVTRTFSGRANRFGYFQPPPGQLFRFDTPGEFRVDISASYSAPDGTLWAGAMTWGNVVEGPNAGMEAHGRRGMDYGSDRLDDMPAWYEVFNLPPAKIGIENFYPYFSGDVHWGVKHSRLGPGDSILPTVTFKDTSPDQRLYGLLRRNYPPWRGFRAPPVTRNKDGLNSRIAVGEAPLEIATRNGAEFDPRVAPKEVTLWGYGYATSQRPDVRVREIISGDQSGTAYWRFTDTYGYQIGESAAGDLPGDLKWEFGGAVLRAPAEGINEYAVYSSLWVLAPDDDPVGTRVAPPFQNATGASIDGGPILKLKGQDVDMLFLPKGVRPGDVLEVGDTVAFSGHVGPPLDSVVSVTMVAPSGEQRSRTFRANRIGWVYDPAFDFAASEPGRWRVYVAVLHDRPYVGNGVTPKSHNTGTVLGTEGWYEFSVAPKDSPRLEIHSPAPGFVSWPKGQVAPIAIRGTAPPGTAQVHYTIHDKGVVMGQGVLTPASDGSFTFTYDARALNAVFPFVSLTAREGMWEGLADEVAINFLAVGGDEIRANTVTLIGEEVFIGGGRQ
jgi:hypothetical protein